MQTSGNLGNVEIFDPRMMAHLLTKFGRRVPEHIGYRDNMAICSLLSIQMAVYLASHPKATAPLEHDLRIINLREYTA